MPKILIVDDECLTRLEIEGMLTDLGYDVAGQAETGAEAVAMARELNPDLILMDVKMPGEMNGIDAAREIKAELKIPIVFISGYGDPEYIEAAKEIAPLGYVMKPFDEREVHAFVEIALSRKKLELELEKSHKHLEEVNLDLKKEIAARKKAESVLQESEKKYRTLVETNPYGFQNIDSTGIITYTNATFQQMTGYTQEELSGKSILNLIEPASKRDELREYISILVKEQPLPTTNSQKLRTKDGRVIDIEIAWKYNRDNKGGVVGFSSIITDVTERKRVQKMFREGQERLSIALQGSNSGIWDWHIKTGEVFFDDTYFKISGYVPNEFPHSYEEWKKRVHADDIEKAERKIRSYVTGKAKEYSAEFRFKTKTNDWMWIHSQGKIFEYDDHGNPARFTGTHLDITERKRAEEALRKSQEKYSKLFQSNPQWLSIATVEDGRFVEVNDAVKEITGYERDELIGRTSKELGIYADYEKRSGFVKIVQEQGGFREKEVAIIKKNGEHVSVLWSAATIEIMGTAYFINSVADINERKRAEQALKNNQIFLERIINSTLSL